MKIVFAGSPQFGAIILEALLKANFSIPLVLTKSDKPAGRDKKVLPTPVKMVAEKFKIPTSSPTKLDSPDFLAKLKKLTPELIVVAAYGKIFPKEVLELPKFGVLNVHPSLLPKFRGPAPIQFAILQGETKTGVTIIKMDENLDEGDIVAQKDLLIEERDTTKSLTEKLANLGAKLLVETIPKWAANQIKPTSQNHLKATYTSQLSKNDGQIDLDNPPDPEKFARMVRAFYAWPGVWTQLKIQSGKSKVVKFLPENLIQIEGRKPQTIKEFFNGYPQVKPLLEKLQLVK